MNEVSEKLANITDKTNSIYSLIALNDNTVNVFLNSDENDLTKSPSAFMHHSNYGKVRGKFSPSPSLKLLFLTGNINELKKMTNKIVITDSLPDANSISIPTLQDTIIFFREYSYYGNLDTQNVLNNTLVPTRDIKSLTVIKKSFQAKLKNQKFISDRIPYFNQFSIKNKSFSIEDEINKNASHD